MKKIILATQSKSRIKLMKSLGVDFEIKPSHIDEQKVPFKIEIEKAKEISKAKAMEISESVSQAIIIASDTYCVVDNQVLEKPNDLEDAKTMLRKQSSQVVTCQTGFCYLDKYNNIEVNKLISTEMVFRKISEREIEKYIAKYPVLEWSAAYHPDNVEGASFLKSVSGSFTSFFYGLPIEEVVACFEKSGIEI
jgi:septum formation protein